MNQERMHVLFVCSRNQWRSPTAERCYRNDVRLDVRSRGTTRKAEQRITATDLAWADVVMVMEDKHRKRILSDFPDVTKFKPIHVLDIPDDYQFMDAELIDLLKSAVDPIVDDQLAAE